MITLLSSTPARCLLLAALLSSLASGCATSGPDDAESVLADTVATEILPEDPSHTRLSVVDYPSRNFNRRHLPISLIVIHYTGAAFRESLNALTNDRGDNRVSSHYLIDESGTIFRLVDEPKRAWHAGVGQWNGIRDVNSASIGIEIVNPGPLPNGLLKPFTSEQIDAVTQLCLDIQSRHAIHDVVGHEDVAPLRKVDPGPLFPWKKLKDKGVRVRTRDTP